MAGQCFVVATPLGNLADISQRALDSLRAVDVIACEDTRVSRKLLQHYGITTKLTALHAHNEAGQGQQLLARLQAGESVALISDAGTPLISDPGARLISLLQDNAIDVVPIPGPCALIAALSASGFAADNFSFLGFLPTKKGQLTTVMENINISEQTTICYEAPHRILATMQALAAALASEREVCVAREISKCFETIRRGPISEILAWMQADSNQQRGEFVVLISGIKHEKSDLNDDDKRIFKCLLEELPAKQALALAVKITGKRRNQLYAWRESLLHGQ